MHGNTLHNAKAKAKEDGKQSFTTCEQGRQEEQTQPHKTRVADRWLRLTRTLTSDEKRAAATLLHAKAAPSIDRKRHRVTAWTAAEPPRARAGNRDT